MIEDMLISQMRELRLKRVQHLVQVQPLVTRKQVCLQYISYDRRVLWWEKTEHPPSRERGVLSR